MYMTSEITSALLVIILIQANKLILQTFCFILTFSIFFGITYTLGTYGGGQKITLAGKGFDESVQVTVCNKTCEIQDASYSSVICETPTQGNAFN